MTTRSLPRGGPILIFNFKFCSLPEELFAINDKQPETAGSRTSPHHLEGAGSAISNFVKRPLLTYVPQDNPKPVECPFGSDKPYVPEVLEEARARAPSYPYKAVGGLHIVIYVPSCLRDA